MGIASFQNLLAPHATTLLLLPQDSTSTSTPHHFAIIDGPGLAYHALHIAKSLVQTRLAQWRRKCKQQNPTIASKFARRERALAHVTAATPSYRAVAAAMLVWLDALKDHGIQVKAILFDGALPIAKQNVRNERMSKLVVKLHGCRDLFTEEEEEEEDDALLADGNEILDIRLAGHKEYQGSKKFSGNIPIAQNHVTGNVALPRDEFDFPPPIFLVSAMVECLRKHDLYANVTRMVPGEADPFCAAYAQTLATQDPDASLLIVTSDSDLFAYEFCDRVQIMLFKDINMLGDVESQLHSLSARVYCTSQIAKQYDLDSLLPLAYSVHTDRYRSLGTHLIEARKLAKCTTEAYKGFRRQYETFDFELKSLEVESALQGLDTKVSEVLHSWLDSTGMIRNGDMISVYLPSSSEDAQRASMWSYGAELRQLGFSILIKTRSASKTLMSEHFRKGKRVGETPVQLLSGSAIVIRIQELMGMLDEGRCLLAATDVAMSWRALCLFYLCKTYVAEDRAMPRQFELARIYQGQVMKTWHATQTQAQYHAILDSWRILLQCLRIHVELAQGPCRIREVEKLLAVMQSVVGFTIPNMFDPMPHTNMTKDTDQMLTKIFDHLGIVEQPLKPKDTKKTRKRKNKHKTEATQKVMRTGHAGNNIFSMLAEEND